MAGWGEATANLTQVKLGGGSVDMFSKAPCEMILDVIGYYKPVPAPSAKAASSGSTQRGGRSTPATRSGTSAPARR